MKLVVKVEVVVVVVVVVVVEEVGVVILPYQCGHMLDGCSLVVMWMHSKGTDEERS